MNQVEIAIHNTTCRSTGETPSQFLFGNDHKGKINDNVGSFPEDFVDDERNLQQMRGKASTNIKRNQESSIDCYDEKRKTAKVYKTGDYVMITIKILSKVVTRPDDDLLPPGLVTHICRG